MRSSSQRICACLFTVSAAGAQMQSYPPGSHSVPVRGEIESSSVLIGSVTVELSSTGASRGDSTTVGSDGRFEFPAVAAGMYWLRVISSDGRVLHEEPVTISGSGQTLTVRIKEDQKANRSADSTVSIQQLTHKVPREAQKAYDKGRQAASKNDERAAAEYFRQAVTADPEFVDAHNDLGAAEASLGQLQEAVEQFQKAIDLQPEHRLALPNLSIVLAKLKRFGEAAEVARRALRVVPGMAKMQYILAIGLLSENKGTQEAIRNLRSASGEIPKAHLIAAEALVDCGKRDEAVLELEQYLGTLKQSDPQRAKVEARLTELRQQ